MEVPRLDDVSCRNLFLSLARLGAEHSQAVDALIAPLAGVPLAVNLLAHVALEERDLAILGQRWTRERTKLLDRYPDTDDRDLSYRVSVEVSLNSPRIANSPSAGPRSNASERGRIPPVSAGRAILNARAN